MLSYLTPCSAFKHML